MPLSWLFLRKHLLEEEIATNCPRQTNKKNIISKRVAIIYLQAVYWQDCPYFLVKSLNTMCYVTHISLHKEEKN